MAIKPTILIISSVTGLAAITGGTLAVIQHSQPPQPSPIVASPRSTDAISPPTEPLVSPSEPPSSPPSNDRGPTQPDRPPQPAGDMATRDRQECRVRMALVNDPNPPLQVRSEPSVETGRVVGQLEDGVFVTVEREEQGWFKITIPLEGWIAKNRTVSTCGEKLETVRFAPGGDAAEIADEFVGTGSHQYRLQLDKGQTLSLKSEVGPLPSVQAPDGSYLTGMSEDRTTWSTQLPQSGEYTFEMESNYRGYKYDFVVQVK